MIALDRALQSWAALIAQDVGASFAETSAFWEDADDIVHDIALARWRGIQRNAARYAALPAKRRAGTLHRLRRSERLDDRLTAACIAGMKREHE